MKLVLYFFVNRKFSSSFKMSEVGSLPVTKCTIKEYRKKYYRKGPMLNIVKILSCWLFSEIIVNIC